MCLCVREKSHTVSCEEKLIVFACHLCYHPLTAATQSCNSPIDTMLAKLLALGGVAAAFCLALKRGHHTRRVVIRTYADSTPLGFVRLTFDDALGGITYAHVRKAIEEHGIVLGAYVFILEGGVPVAQSQEEDEYVAKGTTDCWVEYDTSPVVRMAWYDVVPMAQPPASESTSACTVTPEPSHLVLRAATAAGE